MGIEIERKFLLPHGCKYEVIEVTNIEQGYLYSDKLQSVRIRSIEYVSQNYFAAYITIKNTFNYEGLGHNEYEYEIPYNDAKEMLLTCEKTLKKQRSVMALRNGLYLEIDEFKDELSGLIIGEVEFETEEAARDFIFPSFMQDYKELTADSRFKNMNLVKMTSQEAKDLINAVYS